MTFVLNGRRFDGQLTESVGTQTERLALTPSNGDLVFQQDVEGVYRYDGAVSAWTLVDIEVPADADYGLPFRSLKLYVDPAGDDDNDGLDPARPKATLQGVMDDLNGVGRFPTNTFIYVRPNPGTYAGNINLTAFVDFGVFVIPPFASFTNNEIFTVTGDNGEINIAERESATDGGFTTFGQAERFYWRDDGLGGDGDLFPVMGNATLPSTSPNLRTVSNSAVSTGSYTMCQYEVVLQVSSVQGPKDGSQLFFYGCHLDMNAAGVPALRDISLRGCKVTHSGGASTVILSGSPVHTLNQFWQGCHLDLPSAVNMFLGATPMTIFSCHFIDGGLRPFAGRSSLNTILMESPAYVRVGGFTNSEATGCVMSLGQIRSLRTSGQVFLVTGGSSVRVNGNLSFPSYTGSGAIRIEEQSRWAHQSGDIIAANASLTGPIVEILEQSAFLDVAGGISGITTNPAGNDVKVGNLPGQAWSAGSSTDPATLARFDSGDPQRIEVGAVLQQQIFS